MYGDVIDLRWLSFRKLLVIASPSRYFGFQVVDFSLQSGQLLVQGGEARAAGHVERVEKVGNPLDGSRDELDILPVGPVLLRLALQSLAMNLSLRLGHGDDSQEDV